ncbi:Probable protease SohB [Buchnera aphidicola (Eriosoma grossulariae)]|uniref:protease SohB n=1 Tax=Buchnera aphidicola TaxID=9 RepID=UPI003463C1CF
MNFLCNYFLFISKFFTIIILTITTCFFIANIISKKRSNNGKIKITILDKDFEDIKNNILLSTMSTIEKKIWYKLKKKKIKNKIHQAKIAGLNNLNINKPKLYILDFKGSTDAHEVSNLRKEISAIISVAQKNDEVLLRLESSGGIVHGYGLAASQLQRLKNRNIYLTIVVDKIAASGGYMMACVADHLVAAPFSIIGSIGVVSQLPNFNRFLKKNDIDFELHTSGSHKRNLTIFGKNNEEGRKNLCDQLKIIHTLFKTFVKDMRPNLDIDSVSNGEYWFGSVALKKGLIDDINTSDDIIFSKKNRFCLIHIQYLKKKNFLSFLLKNVLNNLINIIRIFI